MRRSARTFLFGFAAVALAGGVAVAKGKAPEWWHSTVTIENSSDYDITHFYLSPSDKKSWGKDWLGKDTFDKGDTIKLVGIECDTYDLKMVDEDKDECVIEDIDLCLEDADWDITNDVLAECQGWDKD